MYKYAFLFCLITSFVNVHAQETHLGLRIGINSATLNGTAEENAAFSVQSGFHIGPTFSYSFSDLMGLRGELIFSQKGSKFIYNGPSYFSIRKNNDYITTTGTRNMTSAINNNYLDIPLQFYTLFFERIELGVGGYGSVLVGSIQKGEINYTGRRDNSSATVGPLRFLLDGNYYSDKAGEQTGTVTQVIKIEGDQINVPERLGGYYEYRTKPSGNKYNTLDYGLIGSVNLRVSGGLYLGLRYQHGLKDVSNDAFDISYKSLSATKEFILIPQAFKNRTLQFSVLLQL